MPAGSDITIATVRVPSAAILALFTTPFQIVPPQGLRTIVVPVFCAIRCNAGTVAYTVAAANLVLGYAPQLPASGLMLGSQAVMNQTFSRYAVLVGSGAAIVDTIPNIENQGLSLAAATQNPTLGNGTLDVAVGYQIIFL